MDAPRISIIILNWNGWRDTIECLESLYRITYPNYDVIVVDNGSKDDSIQKIKEYASGKIKANSKFFKFNPNNKPIKVFEIDEDEAKQGKFDRPLYEKLDPDRRMILIKNKDNYGFAGGNNIGMKFALSVLNPDYVLLLNNDTVVDRHFLDELVKVAESDKKIGIVGPKVYYYNYNGRSDVIVFTGVNLLLWKGGEKCYGFRKIDNGQWDMLMEVDKIEGSCMLIKKEVLQNVGFFDDSFFAYWEETDLCFRSKKAGYKLVYVPSAKVWHKVDESLSKSSWFRVYLLSRNKIFFYRKNMLTGYSFLNFVYFILVDFWLKLLIYSKIGALSLFIWYSLGMLDGVLGITNRIKLK